MRKRFSFTLVELMVSLGLMSVLFSSLFFWYGKTKSSSNALVATKNVIMEELYAKRLLDKVVPRATRYETSNDKITPFYSDTFPSLVFTFDRGPHINPQLANEVLARLYLDKKDQALCLGIWPVLEKGEAAQSDPHERHVILSDVQDLSFAFYYPPNNNSPTVDISNVGEPAPLEGWQKKWELAYDCLPALVELTVQRGKHTHFNERSLTFVFSLKKGELFPLVYPKEAL